ncbi:hypothetical protein [Anatilimnocola floriformis]|uniref:hypothetical protein n=1 Tax=Anatilimnocola floriformis TaxID=2948575 RepID=UPI0020C4B8BB|nr:hypothetical protein [Anatilimnocola floriformis]
MAPRSEFPCGVEPCSAISGVSHLHCRIRVELIDGITKQVIAAIVSVGRNWQWNRNTTKLLHGAPPAQGVSPGLTQAKVSVLDGLPA